MGAQTANPFRRQPDDGMDELLLTATSSSTVPVPPSRNPWRAKEQLANTPSKHDLATQPAQDLQISGAPEAVPAQEEGWFAQWKAKSRKQLTLAAVCTFVPLTVMYIVQILHSTVFPDLAQYGVFPRTAIGLRGIILAPFIHVGWGHLLANTTGWIFLGFPLALRGVSLFISCSLFLMLFSGFFVWCFGAAVYHVGASGIIFGFFAFTLATACLERPINVKAILLAVIVAFFYGSIVFGMIPLFTEEGVSWEYHLGGFIAGNVFAFAFAAHKRRKHNQGQITVPPV